MSEWIYEDDLPDGYDYHANFSRSRIINGVRMFPPETDNSVNQIMACTWKDGRPMHFPVCCHDMVNAFAGGTDNEGYGAVASAWPDGIHLGSIMNAIKYCPWCGAQQKERFDG